MQEKTVYRQSSATTLTPLVPVAVATLRALLPRVPTELLPRRSTVNAPSSELLPRRVPAVRAPTDELLLPRVPTIRAPTAELLLPWVPAIRAPTAELLLPRVPTVRAPTAKLLFRAPIVRAPTITWLLVPRRPTVRPPSPELLPPLSTLLPGHVLPSAIQCPHSRILLLGLVAPLPPIKASCPIAVGVPPVPPKLLVCRRVARGRLVLLRLRPIFPSAINPTAVAIPATEGWPRVARA